MSVEEKENQVQQYRDRIIKLLETEGAMEQIRLTIRDSLTRSQWRDEVKQLSLKQITADNIEEISSESIVEQIWDKVVVALPKNLHSSVEKSIKDVLTKKQVINDEK